MKTSKKFFSQFGKTYELEILSREEINAAIDGINMNAVISQVYNELPDLQGCSNTCYLDVSTGDTFTHIQVGNGGIVEDAHLIELYSITRGAGTDFSVEDIAGDDELPESGSVKDFPDYEERVLNCLEYNFENKEDKYDIIDSRLDEIYGMDTEEEKTILVNIEKQTVTLNNETCNFYEAGLIPNGVVITDPEEIKEHLIEREGMSVIIFES